MMCKANINDNQAKQIKQQLIQPKNIKQQLIQPKTSIAKPNNESKGTQESRGTNTSRLIIQFGTYV
jgi:hypothetical protein